MATDDTVVLFCEYFQDVKYILDALITNTFQNRKRTTIQFVNYRRFIYFLKILNSLNTSSVKFILQRGITDVYIIRVIPI